MLVFHFFCVCEEGREGEKGREGEEGKGGGEEEGEGKGRER